MNDIYDIFIGIDPSTNSSGVVILTYKDDELINENYYIIKPDKLTKKEAAAELAVPQFSYVIYDKLSSEEDDDHFEAEIKKTKNFIKIVSKCSECILKEANKYKFNYRLHICQESISYGSVKLTRSIFDLSGLNYLLRNMALHLADCELTVATPSEIKKFASGAGNAKKEIMVQLFKACHPDFDLPKLDDVADAYWMAKFGKNIWDENK